MGELTKLLALKCHQKLPDGVVRVCDILWAYVNNGIPMIVIQNPSTGVCQVRPISDAVLKPA